MKRRFDNVSIPGARFHDLIPQVKNIVRKERRPIIMIEIGQCDLTFKCKRTGFIKIDTRLDVEQLINKIKVKLEQWRNINPKRQNL